MPDENLHSKIRPHQTQGTKLTLLSSHILITNPFHQILIRNNSDNEKKEEFT